MSSKQRRQAGGPLFTLQTDLDLGAPMAPWLRSTGADVTIRQGDVPDALPKPAFEYPRWQSAGDRFLIRLPCDVRVLIEGGEVIRYAPGPDASLMDLRAFLLSMGWAVLAMQRGMLPLHASSVSRDGDVHAFAGRSGVGKSTLAAALTQRGYELFTGDILVVDPASSDADVTCLGHRALSLHDDGLRLSGAAPTALARTRGNACKWYAAPARSSPHGTGRLRSLHLVGSPGLMPPWPEGRLAVGATAWLVGREAVEAFHAALYRGKLFTKAVLGRRPVLEGLAKAIRHMRIGTFCHHGDPARFDEDLDSLAADLPCA